MSTQRADTSTRSVEMLNCEGKGLKWEHTKRGRVYLKFWLKWLKRERRRTKGGKFKFWVDGWGNTIKKPLIFIFLAFIKKVAVKTAMF